MLLGLRFNEEKDYNDISKKRYSLFGLAIQFLITAFIPALCGYIGFTQTGWISPSGNLNIVLPSTANTLAVITYLTYILTIFILGNSIYWMRDTYNAKDITQRTAFIFAYYCSIPFIFASLTLLYPNLILNTIALVAAIAYSVKLLFKGLYKISNIEPERGFLYASSVLTVALVGMVCILVLTTILWINGFFPNLQ
tara:strand:+ start:23355 stop:23942 length:588 start_codon:yes stop_codon:yes gene_type:complete